MNGLIMDYELNVPAILRRGEQLFAHKQIVTRRTDKSFHRYTYADFAQRTKQLTLALKGLGLAGGRPRRHARWNHYQHLEAYFGSRSAGMVTAHAEPAAAPRRHRPTSPRTRATRR